MFSVSNLACATNVQVLQQKQRLKKNQKKHGICKAKPCYLYFFFFFAELRPFGCLALH